MADNDDPVIVKIVTIITLGVLVWTAEVGITVTAILTDRDVARAEAYTAGGAIVLALLGGFSWAMIHRRRRHWHVSVDRNNGKDSDEH